MLILAKKKITWLSLLSILFPSYIFQNPYPSLASLNRDHVHEKISARLWYDMIKYGKKHVKTGYRINIPLLIIHGTNDKISQHKASVNFSRNTGLFTTFKSFKNATHFLLEENDRYEILDYMYNWICKKVNLK